MHNEECVGASRIAFIVCYNLEDPLDCLVWKRKRERKKNRKTRYVEENKMQRNPDKDSRETRCSADGGKFSPTAPVIFSATAEEEVVTRNWSQLRHLVLSLFRDFFLWCLFFFSGRWGSASRIRWPQLVCVGLTCYAPLERALCSGHDRRLRSWELSASFFWIATVGGIRIDIVRVHCSR